MGKKLVEAFKTYLDQNVTIDKIRKLTDAVLEAADDANAEHPASSSGKYHPVSDMGPGGNVRHAKLVAEIAKVMMRADEFFDDKRNWELTVVSCVLHDICKYDSTKDVSHTQFEHPILAAELIKKVGAELKEKENDEVYINMAYVIALNVETHMGRWNTSKYSDIELPRPKNDVQKLVQLADLISANKELPLTMFAYAEEAEKELKNIDGK